MPVGDAAASAPLHLEGFGFGLHDLRGFMLNGVDGSWAPEAARAAWPRGWAAEFDALRARLAPGEA